MSAQIARVPLTLAARLFSAAALLTVLLGTWLVPSAHAQGQGLPDDATNPTISFAPQSGTVFTSASANIQVFWSDNQQLALATRHIYLNGVEVTSSFTHTTGTTSATSTGSLALQTGSNTVMATVEDATGNQGSASTSYTRVSIGVAVTPDGAATTTIPGASLSQAFVITNTGASEGDFALSVVCTGVLVNCPAASTVHLLGGQALTYNAGFGTGATAGTGRATLTATYSGNSSISDAGWVDVSSATVSTYAPSVTPDAGVVSVFSGNFASQVFTVRNLGNTAATYNITVTCTGILTNCPAASTLAVPAGGQATTNLSFAAYAVGTGRVRVSASYVGDAAVMDTGSVEVGSAAGGVAPPIVTVADVNYRGTRDRGACVRFSAGPEAEGECGDLVVTHTMPAVRVLGKAYAPVLVYNSQLAHPHPVIRVNVTIPAGAAAPSSVTAILTMYGAQVATSTWAGSAFTPGQPKRIAVGFDAGGHNQDMHPYSLQVTANYGTSSYSTVVNDSVFIVNRVASPFGSGWWLSGAEMLQSTQNSSMLLIQGDGSTRMFRLAGQSWGVWVAEFGNRADTIAYNGAGYYSRKLRGGGEIRYNGQGYEIAAINRQGFQTTFNWEANTYGGFPMRLASITLPEHSDFQTGKSFVFGYANAQSPLTSITAPGLTSGAPRVVSIGNDGGGNLISFTDPDGSIVRPEYEAPATHRMTMLTDRRGTAALFTYGMANRLSVVHRLAGGAQSTADDVFLYYTPPEIAGYMGAGAVDTANGYGLLNGPRPDSDVHDYTFLWVDRFGAPRQVMDALGSVSVIQHGDPRFPTAATEVDAPGAGSAAGSVPGSGPRSISRAYFGLRGGVDSTTVVNPLDNGQSGTTRYRYADSRFPDFATDVTGPTGLVSSTGYDAAGNRDWQQAGPDMARRVKFHYNARGQVDSVWTQRAESSTPRERAQRMEYDPQLGNVSAVQSPLGFRTEYLYDGLGQVTHTRTQIDSVRTGPTHWQEQDVQYDIAGRDTLTRSYGPIMLSTLGPVAPADTLEVRKTYDLAGNLLTLAQRSNPDHNAIGTILTRWRYDPLGRRVAEVAPPSATGQVPEIKDSTVYDVAGNAVSVITRRGHTLSMTYDALNRLRTRSVPQTQGATYGFTGGWSLPLQPLTLGAETVDLTYDGAGNLLTANNAAAQITRTYYQGGALKDETERVREYAGTAYSHAYTTHYSYDIAGRRTAMRVPGAVAPTGGDSVRYAYDPQTGAAATVTDPLGNAFTPHYDNDGRLTGFDMPGGITEARTYDADGRMRTRTETVANAYVLGAQSTAYGAWETGSMHTDAVRYNARGQVDSAMYITGRVTRDARNTAQLYSYSSLGALLASELVPGGSAARGSASYTQTDAFGNQFSTEEDPTATAPPVFRTFRYEPGSGRLLRYLPPSQVMLSDGSTYYIDTQDNTYDNAGNRVVTEQNFTCFSSGTPNGCGAKKSVSAFYYDAENRLREVHRRSCIVALNGACDYSQALARDYKSGIEEHRYDALGRRVLVRFSSHSTCAASCPNFIQRTIWDGDDVLAEIRAPGGSTDGAQWENDAPTGTTAAANQYGRVLYTQSGSMDHPLDMIRMGFNGFQTPLVVVPHANGRGQYDIGSDPQGRSLGGTACVDPSYSASCGAIEWPGDKNDEFFRSRTNNSTLPPWFGSLQNEGRDQSGQLYMRNRFYDPQSGKFTQEDPIGIAGGLNVYGFADGDPVNFSDPYGLCPGANGEDDGKPCELGDIQQAHGYWLNSAREGLVEGGVRGGVKAAVGIAASTALDFSGATTVDESSRTVADPNASAGAKVLAVARVGLVLAQYAGLVGTNSAARAVRAGTLQEIGTSTRLLGKTGYRGSRIYGLRRAAGRAAGTDKHGFYFSIDNAGHILHIGSWKW